MALRSGYKGFKKLAEGLKMIRPGILSVDNVVLSETYYTRSEQIISGASNLFNLTGNTQTLSDVIYTVNADKTVDAHGKATANTGFQAGVFYPDSGVEYKFTGCPKGGSSTTYLVRLGIRQSASDNWGNTFLGEDKGNGFIIRSDVNAPYGIMIILRVLNDYDANHLLFKPMVSVSDGANISYAPYSMTNQLLTASADDQKTTINAIITAATSAADFAAFKTAMEAITPVTRSLSKEASPEDVPEEVIEEKPVTKKTTKKTVKEGE